MGHGHAHHDHSHHDHTHHDHGDDHGHSHDSTVGAADLPAALDLSIPDSELAPGDLSRRGFLRRAGVLGAGAAAAASGVLGGAFAVPELASARDGAGYGRRGGYLWLAGDHHIHTQYSPDGHVPGHRPGTPRQRRTGWTGWSSPTTAASQHAKIGVEKVNPDIVAARGQIQDTLVFQGLEWNIPAAEHGTVFVHPGSNEVAVLKEFENTYDGVVTGSTASTAANEALAVAGVHFLASAVQSQRVKDALFLANHPARKGIDSPHEIRGWRDADPRIAVGFEGAPGHQAAGIAGATGSRLRPRLLRQLADQRLLRRVPVGELPHLGRLRLDDRHGRRPLGQPAGRGQAMVDHRQLRLALGLPRRRRTRAGQRLPHQRLLQRPGLRRYRRWPPTATSGPATTAVPTSARPTSPTPP